jgi:hypothetical protein
MTELPSLKWPNVLTLNAKKNRHMAYRHRGVFYVVIVERIQDVNSLKQCCSSEMFIPDPRCLSRIRDVIPDPNFSIPDPDPGSKRFQTPDPNPHQRIYVFLSQKTLVLSGPTDWRFWACWRTTYFPPAGTPSPHPRRELLSALQGRLYFNDCIMSSHMYYSVPSL